MNKISTEPEKKEKQDVNINVRKAVWTTITLVMLIFWTNHFFPEQTNDLLVAIKDDWSDIIKEMLNRIKEGPDIYLK